MTAPDGGTEAMVSMTRWRLEPGRATSLVRPKRNADPADIAETPPAAWRCVLAVTLASFGLAITLAQAPTALAQPVPEGTRPTKRIVFLFSDATTVPANSDAERGLREGLEKDNSLLFEYYDEFLDLARFSGEAYRQRLADALSQKYGGLQPHLVVAIGPESAPFAARWGPIVFPDVPVVYCAAFDTAKAGLPSGLGMTGVPLRFDVRRTVELALRLRPRTRTVVLVGGASEADRALMDLARSYLSGLDHDHEVTLKFWTGLPMKELIARVAALPEDAVVDFVAMYRDGAGAPFVPRRALELVAARCAVPVFGSFETYLGGGIVGGFLYSFHDAGRRTADLALRVLHGEKPGELTPSVEGLSLPMFDARQLARWGIRESALPPGSVVRFRQPSLWREHPWLVLGTLLFFLAETGLVVGLVVERRRRQRAEETHKLLSAMVESSNDAVIGIAPDKRITSWNKGAQAIFGYAAEEVMGRDVDLLVPLDRLGEAHSAFDEVMAGGAITPFETVRLRKDGTLADLSINDSPIHDQKGRIMGISSTQREITDRKRAEQAVRASEEKFRQFFKEVPDYCYIVSPQGEILDINSAALAALGYDREEIVGKPFATIYAPESQARMKELFAQWQRTGLIVDEETVIITKTGERRAVILNVGAERDHNGTIVHSTSVQTDITDHRRAELETQHLHQELSHVARVTMMGELTSSLAHELNQPLTAILSNAQAAQRLLGGAEPDLEEFREILADIVADDDRAGEIIQRLRTLLRKGELEFRDIDVNQLVREVAGLIRSDTIIKNISVTLDLASDLPRVRGDRVQLQQVILNLLLNGLDALMSRPGPDRKLLIHTETGTDGTVNVAVHDSGPGIPPEKLERVFEPFFTTKGNGMGMGLAIARSILHSHGGRLWAENAPGGGATFTLALPATR